MTRGEKFSVILAIAGVIVATVAWVAFVANSPPPKGHRYAASRDDAKPLLTFYETIQQFHQNTDAWPTSIEHVRNWAQSNGLAVPAFPRGLEYYPDHLILRDGLKDEEIIIASRQKERDGESIFVLYGDGFVAELRSSVAKLLISTQTNLTKEER